MIVGNRDQNSTLEGLAGVWGITDIKSFTTLRHLDPRLGAGLGSPQLPRKRRVGIPES